MFKSIGSVDKSGESLIREWERFIGVWEVFINP